ncbi:NAD-dependent protein deacylase [Candidatus Saccharibacteria bacterium]|nr:NAD-dependent protein deacylase [Candidatus Saccharibacteria bacterium]
MSTETDDQIARLKEIIADSNKIVFFGGAGVSTESGIPDFRSKDGLYNQHDVRFDDYSPEYLLSDNCLFDEPKVFFEYYRQKLDARKCEPNPAHKKLVEWEKDGKLLGVITQNIDGLHQKAGSKNVVELHGTTQKCHCVACGAEYDGDYIFEHERAVPRCEKCNDMVRPDVVLYGEELPEDAWMQAEKWIAEADCLIVCGTSLAVYPAAALPRRFDGKYIVVINRDTTDFDNVADLVIHDSAGKILSQI